MPPASSGSSSSPDPARLEGLRDRLRAQRGERLAELALERGWISESQLDEALEAAESGGPGPVAWLVERGRLTPEQAARLDREPGGPEPPPEAAAAAADPSRRFGKYVLVAELGRGGMGVVHRAWQADLGRWVALKRIRTDRGPQVERFLREAALAARIVHPNLVPLHEAGEIDGVAYLAMALIDGTSLDDRKLEPARAVEVMATIASVVQRLHEAGILHRDIKPGNLLEDAAGRIYLADFGLARADDSGPALTKSGVLLGTPAFAPPEQIRGERDRLDARADVYALGATLHALLTGRPPFDGSDAFDVARNVIEREPGPAGPDPRLESILRRAMAKNPADRYPTAEALAADLRRHLEGRPVTGRSPSALSRLRRRRVPILVAALVVALGALALWRSAASPPAGDLLLLADRELEEGVRLLAGGPSSAVEAQRRFASALGQVEAAVALRPESPDAWFRKGRLLAYRGRHEEAIRAFRRAGELSPGSRAAIHEQARGRLEQVIALLLGRTVRPKYAPCCPEGVVDAPAAGWLPDESWARARSGLAEAGRLYATLPGDPSKLAIATTCGLMVERRSEEAYAACERRIAEGGTDAELPLLLGLIDLLRGRGVEAAARFEDLVRRHPGSALARLGLAAARQDPRAAAEDAGAAIALLPDAGVGWLNRGAARLRAGDPRGALEDFDEAARRDPADPSARRFRVVALCALRDLEGAAREAAALPADADGAWLEATVLVAREPGRLEAHREAIFVAIARALDRDPGHPPSLLLRSHVRLHLGDGARALADIDRALAHPRAPATWRAVRGVVLAGLGRLPEALAEYDAALAHSPSLAEVLALRADVRIESARLPEARADLDLALRLDPGLAAAWFCRARLRRLGEDWAGALADSERGYALGPWDDPRSRRIYARSLLVAGRTAEAVREYTTLISRPEPRPEWFGDLGEAQAAAGHADAAVASLQKAIALDPALEARYGRLLEEQRRKSR